MKKFTTLAVAAALVLVACGDDRSTTDATQAPATTVTATDAPPATDSMPAPETTAGDDGVLNVPEDFATIQAAVDAAQPGDLILIGPGTYHEAVNVVTDQLTIRGLDRNEVVLDGEFDLDNGIRILGAKGVAVENMTATNYTSNGFFWTGVDGYRGSYLTAYRTGDYGVYAFDSINGQLDHIYAAGSPDAGIYIGECYPCNAVVTDVVSEHNGLGYSGTNSGGNLIIINSVFRYNRAGVVPNSGSYELCYPERDTTIVGNLVYSNNQGDTPAIDVALLAMGNGIVVAGGVLNDVERNQIWDHDKAGIALVPYLEEDPNDDLPTPEEWDVTCADAKQQLPQDPGGAILWNAQ
ncbi:MAG: right-handed parallel beta-helix repeat-containing protein, partial [Ilumatobacter sp.]|nr:right-handed parallel beta-helix repeat-containing protein [Ilumatobacter sp.]